MKTIEQIKKEYLTFTAERIENFKREILKLETEDKDDEAILVKVKLNIINIFDTLLSTCEKKMINKKQLSQQDMVTGFCEEFLAFFDKIPENWRINYEKAKEHNDVTQYVIEECKLSEAALLKNQFEQVIK